MLRADLHVHTSFSRDGVMPPQQLISLCLARGIDCLAVTDHNTIRGAIEVAREAPFRVIVGEEIKTSEGEIIGLFLEEEIPRGLSPEETVTRIRAQGGLVMLPHPYDHLRRSTLRRDALDRIAPLADIIEVFNARLLLKRHIAQARELASRHNRLVSAGSDSHVPAEIGHAYVEMPEFQGKHDFLDSLAAGSLHGHLTSPLVHVATTWNKWNRGRRATSKSG